MANRETRRSNAKTIKSKLTKKDLKELEKGIELSNKVVSIPVTGAEKNLELNFNDEGLFVRLFDLVDFGMSIDKVAQEKIDAIDDTLDDFHKYRALVKANYEVSKLFADEVDKCFGTGTVMSIFGVLAPSGDSLMELIEKLKPYFDLGMMKRSESMQRFVASSKDTLEDA